jgi:transcription antitermination protein NusB
MSTGRRRAREECFKALYRMQVAEETAATVIDTVKHDPALDPDVVDYAVHLLAVIDMNRDEIDAALSATLARWNLERVAQTDRAVLRMGVAELLFSRDVPVKVAIDEAIEIAKRYGTPASGRFVNGVLDSVARANQPPSGEVQPEAGERP